MRYLLIAMTMLPAIWPYASATAEGEEPPQWRWEPALLPKALAVEGLWTDTWRLREALRRVGLPCDGAYRSTKGVKGLPPSPDAYRAFSLIVLSNVDAPAISDKQLAVMRQFVEAGGGLVVLGGFWAFGRGGYQGSPLEEMLPVTFEASGAIARAPEGLALRPAPSVTWLKDCDFSVRPCAFFVHELKPKPGAAVHVSAGDKPVLVSWTFGRGRVVACGLTVNGQAPRGVLPFWEWRDWTELLGQTMDWAASSRPLEGPVTDVPSRAVGPASADYLELLTGEKKDPKALRALCEQMTKAMAHEFFDAWQENPERFSGDEFEALFTAMTPFASRDWAPVLQSYLSGLVVNASHRRSALVLLGATGSKEASRTLLDALKDEKLASSAARGLGLSGNRETIASLERAYGNAMHRARSQEHPDRIDPEAFAGDCADTAAECALALYKLGAADAVERLAQTYARLHFYRRVFRNSCKMPNWDDVMHRWKQGKRLEATLKRLQRAAGPVPGSQFASFCVFARAVTDPVQAEWARLAMEQSRHTVEPGGWVPLHEARDGVVARLARVLSRPRPQPGEER